MGSASFPTFVTAYGVNTTLAIYSDANRTQEDVRSTTWHRSSLKSYILFTSPSKIDSLAFFYAQQFEIFHDKSDGLLNNNLPPLGRTLIRLDG